MPIPKLIQSEKRLDDLVSGRCLGLNRHSRVILSIEEHRDIGDLLQVLLWMNGYNVYPVNNTADAARLIMQEHFDLFLVGDLWPLGSNIELAKIIRKVNRYTPLIFHSVQAKPGFAEWGLSAGTQAYLTKPCDIDKMMKTIRYHAEDRSARFC